VNVRPLWGASAGLLLCLPLLVAAVPASQPQVVNDICPVTTEEQATALHEVVFRGVPVRFCCTRCKNKFLLDPQPYLKHLPHVPPADAPHVAAKTSTWTFSQVSQRLQEMSEAWRPYLIAAVAAAVLYLFAVARVRRMRRRQQTSDGMPLGRTSRTLALLARPSTLLIVILGLIVAGQFFRSPKPSNHPAGSSSPLLETERRFASEIARQGVIQGPEFVSLLDKVYYRGNDERAATLFNGGVYRTCVFRIGLRNEDGEPVEVGQKMPRQRLFLRVEIERAPHTLDSHFAEEAMNAACLVQRGLSASMSPPAAFSSMELEKRWAAGCALGEIDPGQDIQHFDGTVLLCPNAENSPDAWTQAQYGIQYNLRLEKGAIMPSSKLWLVALFFTADLPDERLHEWLSIRPLPEIPEGFRHVSETE
jgi:hypothetical protein